MIMKNFQACVEMSPSEALCRRKCRTLIGWKEVRKQKSYDIGFVEKFAEGAKSIYHLEIAFGYANKGDVN